MNFSGDGLYAEEQDALRLSLGTIANIGSERDLSCSTSIPAPQCSNATSVSISLPFAGSSTYASKDIGLGIAVMDLVASVVFLLFIALFRGKLELMTMLSEGNVVTSSHYTVMVRGLPPDATEFEVLQHFNDLYDLASDDWTDPGSCCGLVGRKSSRRPPMQSKSQNSLDHGKTGPNRKFKYDVHSNMTVGPVLNATNTGNPQYLRTYIAEVVLCNPIGNLLRSYQRHTSVLMKLLRTRAAVKKYSKASVHRNKRAFQAANAKLAKLDKKVQSFNAKYAAKYNRNVR